MVREYVQVSGCGSIEALIAALEAVKSQVPPGSSDAEVRLRGDDVFGRHIRVTYSPVRRLRRWRSRGGRKISPSWSAAPVSRFG